MRTIKKNPIDWLFPEVRKKVLALLLASPRQSWYLRDIARKTGSALGTVRRELAGLANAEIVNKSKDGNRTYYQANTNCPFFMELSGLLRKTVGIVGLLQEVLRPLSDRVKVAFVYGSFAKGSAKASSDVDLVVIGSCSFGKIVDATGDTQNKIDREINPTVYSVKEWREKFKAKHHFVTSVLASKKIFIIGTADELAKLTESRQNRQASNIP